MLVSPLISIVIPTLGRPLLLRTLESLSQAHEFERSEILIVGQVKDEQVRKELEKFVAEHPNVRWLDVAFDKGDSSRKKNLGYQEARAAVVAFLDDDVVVEPDWIQRISEPFSEEQVGLVSGPGLVPSDLPYIARLAGQALASKAAGYVSLRYQSKGAAPVPVKWSRLIGCNMAYRKKVLEEIGGFDPKFWPGEEMLAAYRATSRGHILMFHPGARVYHYPRHTLFSFLKQMFGYGATRIRLIRAGVDVEWTPLVPMVWVLSLAVLIPLALFSGFARYLLGANLFVYGVVDLWITGAKVLETKNWRDVGLLFIVPLMHLSYGLAEWVEFFCPMRDLSEQG